MDISGLTKKLPYIHIIFSDNGIGFEQEFSEKIFAIFQRLNNRQYNGTGIGLALCKKIVENHHGLITANSEPGQGATFHIYLPSPKWIYQRVRHQYSSNNRFNIHRQIRTLTAYISNDLFTRLYLTKWNAHEINRPKYGCTYWAYVFSHFTFYNAAGKFWGMEFQWYKKSQWPVCILLIAFFTRIAICWYPWFKEGMALNRIWL